MHSTLNLQIKSPLYDNLWTWNICVTINLISFRNFNVLTRNYCHRIKRKKNYPANFAFGPVICQLAQRNYENNRHQRDYLNILLNTEMKWITSSEIMKFDMTMKTAFGQYIKLLIIKLNSSKFASKFSFVEVK